MTALSPSQLTNKSLLISEPEGLAPVLILATNGIHTTDNARLFCLATTASGCESTTGISPSYSWHLGSPFLAS
jgi:hypothetical protein